MRMLKKGFTLAEVLITLLIIGVIASIVIPGLINDTRDAEYNAGIKKIYADLSVAAKLIQVNNQGTVTVGTSSGTTACTAFRDEFCTVMSCVKKDSALNIFGNTYYKFYKGGNWSQDNTSTDLAAVLNNGTLLYFRSLANCTSYGVNACGEVRVDLNGNKGPNMFGKDYYWFYVTLKNTGTGNGVYTILPAGSQGDTNAIPGTSCTNAGTNGYGCAAMRLMTPDSMP